MTDGQRGEASGVRFGVLGPVEVLAAGRGLPGLAPRHRAVLGYLLLHAGTVVSPERLIGAVWGDEPPDTARAQVHAAVAAVRRILRPAGAGGALASRAGGYVIALEPGQLDLAEFTSQVAAAAEEAGAGNAPGAAHRIRAALDLWRGEPLAGVTAGYVAATRARLAEHQVSAIERLAEIELSLGRHDAVIGELAEQVAAHPVRERLVGQLMLALHRAGRQPDALSAARAYRAALAEQQGLDPGRSFAALEQAILRDDPHLGQRPAPDAGPAVTRSQEPPGAGQAGTGEHRPQRPVNFLPYDIADFTGREAELGQFTRPEPDAEQVIWLIDGMAGVGKTALAVHAAHLLASRFPDGQLFVDLQAHSSGLEAAEPGAALEILLRQLGVPGELVPDNVTERAAQWRAELSRRSTLVVLDNAAGTDQLRALLPGASRGVFLITSRQRLTGFDGARVLSLDVLPAEDSISLFTSIVGERAGTEPIAVLDVLHMCGFLPLAVRIAAARLQHRPRWTVAYLASRLRDQRRRPAELSAQDRSVAAAFTVSYEHLDPVERRMFRMLGLHPGTDIEATAAAALAAVPVQQAEGLLENLLDAHVLQQREPGRYTFHDLLREHARNTASAQESEAERRGAVTRLLDFYLRTAAAAVDLLYPDDGRYRPPDAGSPDSASPDPADAVGWLEAERANLVAAAAHATGHDWPAHGSHLAAVLRPYLDGRGYYADGLALHAQALSVSRRRGDKVGQGRALVDLGWVCWLVGRYREAGGHSREALRICAETGDRSNQARAENTLGNLYRQQGDQDKAHEHLLRALGLCRELGNRAGEAYALSNLGLVYERRLDHARAIGHYRQALDLHRELGNRGGEADALTNLGRTFHELGQHQRARGDLGRALGLYRELRHGRGEADVRNGLGETATSMGDPALAVADHEAALTLAREIGSLPEQARAHAGLARAHRDLGRAGAAYEQAGLALALYAALGGPEAAETRDLLASLGPT